MSGAAPSMTAVGACPTVHQPFEELDGALVRVRVPGGSLTARQVALLADAADQAGATVEITSRANLQLRGLASSDLPAVAGAVAAAGLGPADAGVDRACDLLTSPTAGIDPGELIDTRPLVRELAGRLAHRSGPALSPKFCILLDGGGAVHVGGRRPDLTLRAVRLPGGSVRFDLQLGEAISFGGDGGPLLLIRPDQAASVAAAAIELAAASGGRLSEVVDWEGRPATVGRIARRAGTVIEEALPAELESTARGQAPDGRAPVGRLDQRQAGLVAVGGMPLLGRLAPATLARLGRLVTELGGGPSVVGRTGASETGAGELRLTPWRSVLLPGLPVEAAGPAIEALSALGLACEHGDPALGVVACAGSAGCPAGLADTQADGRRLIVLLRATPRPTTSSEAVLAVHLSGCPKRCAGRQGHDLTLLAGPVPGTYDLYRQDAGTALGRPMTTGLDPEGALRAVLAVPRPGDGGR